ncbi:SGNH/GDSL hydrolase family protein [Kutzneria viridogrisea]|uniref:GDSL family lipase n=2 Tax=Kutzneria TaxID=43356 RepID=W5VY75_9PSEU|nr:SGNH/GDSL hydrolase family protein [Kutzneria albida]AHH93833.1 GDSL family lipase [Kutzneria albida DSM 43870]MBA8931162.1 lysophospholipase L1-like esterase [Kutzneria viridogrisea]
MHSWQSYVAIGDSFTEGLEDPGPDGAYRGWADRLAEIMAAGNPDLRYANLAVRSKKMRHILAEQVPAAVALRPELVSLCGGTNDILRPGADPDAVAALFEQCVRQLTEAGSKVVIFTGIDTKGVPVLQRLRGRIATYNVQLRAIADRYGCLVVDLWPLTALQDRRAWAEDRLHPSPEGHRRIALLVAQTIGVRTEQAWDEPWPPAQELVGLARHRADLRWAQQFLVPWISRRLRGVTSGDGLSAKRPELGPLCQRSRQGQQEKC